MSAILNSLNAHNLLIFQPILMMLVSKFMVYRALSDKTYLSLGLLSPLKGMEHRASCKHIFCPYTHPRPVGLGHKYKYYYCYNYFDKSD